MYCNCKSWYLFYLTHGYRIDLLLRYIVYDMAKAVLFYLISWIYHRIVLLIRYVLLNILYNMLFTILVYMICTHEFCLLPCIYLGYDTIWMHFNKICVQQGVSNSTLERALQSRMQIYKEAIWWVEIKQQKVKIISLIEIKVVEALF